MSRAKCRIVGGITCRWVVPALLVVSTTLLACTDPVARPEGSEQPGGEISRAQPSLSPSRSGPPVPGKMRSVSVVGSGVAASGDFRGNGRSQIALLQDPSRDLSLRINLRDQNADGETFSESTWLATAPNFFALARAKFAVADVTLDGKDDLVALYNDGESRVRLLVFRSTGTTFMAPEVWWRSDEYAWARASNIMGVTLTGAPHDGILIPYQYANFDMRLHYFASTGSSFSYGGSDGVFDSGPGQYDTARARLVVGHFTRSGSPDQLAALYQYPNARVRLQIFDYRTEGFVMDRGGVYETNDGEYDLSRASIGAADVTGDGKDDVLSLYGTDDGSARVHLFDAASSFRPANGYAGVATLPSASTCAGATALLVGDWDGDGKADMDALSPADGSQVRSNLLRNLGGSFKLTPTAEETLCPRWPLTGLPLNRGPVTRRPLYVKIDNNPHARPHYGISKADQVYEWLVEGLTTRLAAVFQSQQPDVIGSVRSARITDTPIVPSFSGAFVYSGGGPAELMRLHYDDAVAHRYVDLSPGYGWGYRVGFREAPHNYFTSYAALRDALAAAPGGNDPVNVPAWDFLPPSNTDPLAGGFGTSAPATSVTIPYRAGFTVRYQYDPASRSYARYDDGVREVDGANGQAVAAKNIVVIQTEVRFTDAFGLDPAGNLKLDMDLTGTQKGVVFRDGRREEVTWTRPDIFDVFDLRNSDGEIVRLSPGQTWIHIVPKDWSIPSQ